MKIRWYVARISAGVILLSAVLGTTQPLTVRAESSQQEGTQIWGTFTLPAPDRGTAELLTERPPSAARDDSALSASTRTSRPETPVGESSDLAGPALESVPETLPGGVGRAAPGTLTVYQNTSLAGGTSRDELNQPAAADNGRAIFATYNAYAGLSTDYGSSWFYVDPATITSGGEGPHGGFSGIQDVIYVPSRDMVIWVIHYNPSYTDDSAFPSDDDETDGNQVRLIIFNGQAELEGLSYYGYTVTPDGLCPAGTDEDWFADPALSLSNNYLYLSANVYRMPSPSTFTCTTVIRFSLDELDAGSGLSYGDWFGDSLRFSFTPAHGATDRFYFAAHLDTNTLQVYDWPESVGPGSVGTTDIDHVAYTFAAAPGYNCVVFGTAVDPCDRLDDRLTTGWLRRDTSELTFMWDEPQRPDGCSGACPFPRIRYIIADVSGGAPSTTLLTDSYIWNSSIAWFLPASGVNARGHVGTVAAYAGGVSSPVYPSCAASVYDDYDLTGFGFANTTVASGTGNPASNEYGDFLRTRQVSGLPFQFLGACYAIEGGQVTPRVVRFGRERDATNPSTIGLYAASWYFLRNANSGGGADLTFQFGWDGPVPLVGDWDSNGTRTVGLDSASWFFLSNSNGAPVADLLFQYGWAGAVPLIGDWDGNGTETIAITDGGWYFLRNSNTPGAADKTFSFGWPSGTPIVGDWDGNGSATVGMYEAGFFYLKNSNSSGPADVTVGFGPNVGATPLIGDWDGNGTDTVGIKVGSTYYLRNSNTPGSADVTFSYGWDSATPLTGNWDGLP